MLQGNAPLDDLDALEEDEPPPPDRKPLVMWLLVVGAALLFLPLWLTTQTIRNEAAGLEGVLSQLQTEAASVPTLPAIAQSLQVTATQIQAQINLLSPVQRQLAATHVDWPGLLAIISEYDDTQMTLTGMAQTENRLVITGRASDDTAVVAYAKLLESSGRFARVVVQSITSLATPVAGPAATPTPSYAAGTPQPIFLKQPLLQSFEAAQEEDAATFLAKAERFYEISTVNLAPGVDTFLTVVLDNGQTFTNDDIGPGTLASKVTFQAPAANTQVVIRVTNLGQAGLTMTYQLLMQEIVPKAVTRSTSTPIAASTAAPGATAPATPSPTATAPPSPTLATTPTARPTASPTATEPPPATLAAEEGAVEFAILVEVKPNTP